MAITKKEARRAAAALRTHVSVEKLNLMLDALMEAGTSKGFRKSINRIKKALTPKETSVAKKAA